MSFGKMTGTLKIIEKVYSTDSEGFKNTTENVVVEVKCYREQRHGSLKWANYASFSQATDLFRFRKIPNVTVTTDYVFECDGIRFKPISVETSKLYVEVLAKRVVPTDG